MKELAAINRNLESVLPSQFSVLQSGVDEEIAIKQMTLSDVLGSGDRLLVFLRHFGCTFCRELVSELTDARTHDARIPSPVYVFIAQAEDGTAFFRRWARQVTAVSDPTQSLYKAFSVERGSLNQLLGPKALVCGLRGLAKGFGVGVPKTDPWLMPGLFLVRDRRVVWRHDFAHAGDHPDFARLADRLHAIP